MTGLGRSRDLVLAVALVHRGLLRTVCALLLLACLLLYQCRRLDHTAALTRTRPLRDRAHLAVCRFVLFVPVPVRTARALHHRPCPVAAALRPRARDGERELRAALGGFATSLDSCLNRLGPEVEPG